MYVFFPKKKKWHTKNFSCGLEAVAWGEKESVQVKAELEFSN